MKYLISFAIVLPLISIGFSYKMMEIQKQLTLDLFELSQNQLGATITSTATSDTLETFRTNVNASLTSLRDDNVSTTTAYSWTALQTFLANASTSQLTATSSSYFATEAGNVGIGSTTPLGVLGIGNTGTSTISGNFFCSYFKDEAGRGMWIKLALSGNVVFATSTTACN
jgi:hypothetical protein